MEEFEDSVYVEGHWVRSYLRRKPKRKRLNDQPPLTERIMGNPDDPRNPVSRKSFEENFGRMGFPRRRY